MTKQGRRELLKAVRPRYLKASRPQKSRILDEFAAATGYQRKYATHLVVHGPPTRSKAKRGRRLTYGPDVVAALAQFWELSGHLCGKRLHPFLPHLVEALERHGELRLAAETRDKLLQMSISTIDRRLERTAPRLPGIGPGGALR